MRIKQKEIDAFIRSLTPYLESNCTALYLFGSRVYDDKKGGDIDLLILTDEKTASQLLFVKAKILIQIQKIIGERKIDLIFTTKEKLKVDPFLKKVAQEMIILHTFSSLGAVKKS